MTRTERRNYNIALGLSIVIHLIFLGAFIPAQQFPRNLFLESIPIGMVEIPAGSSLNGPPAANIAANSGFEDSQPVSPEKDSVVPPPEKKVAVEKDALKIKPTSTPKVTQDPKPLADSIPDQKSKVPAENPKPVPAQTGGGNGGTRNGPIGFGTGEGQVLRLGRMPTYPKGAMNEGKEGDVAVKLLIGANGYLEKVDLMQPAVDERFLKAVMYVIQNEWQFKPESQKYYIDIVFSFSLKTGTCTPKFIRSETLP